MSIVRPGSSADPSTRRARRTGRSRPRGRRQRGEAARVEGDPGAPGLPGRRGRLRCGGTALPHRLGLRSDPAGRTDADHGRFRDGGTDPAAPAVGDDADHLHHRARPGRDRWPTAMPRVQSTSSPPRCNPDELRAKVSVFANLFLQAQALAAQARRCRPPPTSSRCSPRPHPSASSRPTPRTATSTPTRAGARSPASQPTRPPASTGTSSRLGARAHAVVDRVRATRHGRVPSPVRDAVPGATSRVLMLRLEVDQGRSGRQSPAGSGRWPTSPRKRSPRRPCRGAGPGHRGLAPQVGLPGQHEPRDPDADERRHRA